MATRRGRLLQQQWLGLQVLRLPLGGVGAAPGSDRFRRGPGARGAAFRTPGKQPALGEGPWGRPCPHCPAWLDSMPAEILLKILSYLDAATLLCMGCVNRRFYHLANDNLIWIRIYSSAFSPKRYNWRADSVQKTAESVSLLSVEDREAGYWKKEYVMKRMTSLKAALAQVLKPVNLYTGLPEKTKEALRMSGISWVIILREKSGKEHVLEHVDLFINDSSVTIAWYGKAWPCLAALSTLDLCGVLPVFADWPKPPAKNGPRWCSLVAKYSLSDMTDSAVLGCDRFVRLFRLDPGLLVGLWKREEELAFVMASLHVSHLVERSTLGSATAPYQLPAHGALADDGPERGLRGYQLHVDLHSGGAFCLCSTFCNLVTDTVPRFACERRPAPVTVPAARGRRPALTTRTRRARCAWSWCASRRRRSTSSSAWCSASAWRG
ncbi:F-box only protein 15 isoform 3-T3 [Glossophaga mutica]